SLRQPCAPPAIEGDGYSRWHHAQTQPLASLGSVGGASERSHLASTRADRAVVCIAQARLRLRAGALSGTDAQRGSIPARRYRDQSPAMGKDDTPRRLTKRGIQPRPTQPNRPTPQAPMSCRFARLSQSPRKGGLPSIPEQLRLSREVSAYWIL